MRDFVKNDFLNFFIFLTWIILSVLTGHSAWSEPSTRPLYSNNPILAKVDDKPIRLDDLKDAKMQEILLQLFQMQRSLLKFKSVEQLVKNHPELKAQPIPKVTQKNIVQFYNSQPGVKELGNLDEMEGGIRDFLEGSFKQSYADRVYQRALAEGWLVDYLVQPNDFRLVVELGTAIFWSNSSLEDSKKVLLLEFSDFQCPFCKRVQDTMMKLRSRYDNKVQFAYRHYPLPFHKQARGLAEAAECARDQGRFWETQALIYQNPPNGIELSQLVETVQEAGVQNLVEFEKCFTSGKYKARVLKDLRDGSRIGIQGTPTFVIGLHDRQSATVTGEIFSGAVPEQKFVQTIEKYILLSKATPAR